VMMRKEPEPAARASRRGGGSGSGGGAAGRAQVDLPAEAVPGFEKLRAWRAATAKEQGVPAYVIFHDATLRQIAVDRPGSLADLGRISGVGENKLTRYGQPILDTLAE